MAVPLEHIEELLEMCWTAAEDGLTPLDRDRLPTALRCFLPHPIEQDGASPQATIDAMLAQGLLSAQGRLVALSAQGRARAQAIVRRHRLAEVLLHSVLDVSDESVEATACQVEHILNDEVTEAVCAFLGHPPSCPHGRQVPQGPCCQALSESLEPLIIPLARLPVGEEATVVFIHSGRHAYLQRLNLFGLSPGRALRLRQIRPALIVQAGETELALDPHAGEAIFVRRRRRTASDA